MAAAWLAACVSAAPLLNSERIQQRYGNYQVRVLQQSSAERVSSLESRTAGRSTTRTLAIVSFEPAADALLATEHARISAGASIGSTFRAAGWTVDKPLLQIGELHTDSALVSRLMHIARPARLALHAYRFEVVRDEQRLHYATLIELHHPDYLQAGDLRRIYGAAQPADDVRASDVRQRAHAVVDSLSVELAQ